jgi:DNA (cytosine-5)-methyltransferase 1
MGFERPGETSFVIPVADTSAYTQFGNAVVVDVIAAIAEHLRPWLPDRSAPPRQRHLPLPVTTDD